MSRFFSPRHGALIPYTPGEQPQEQQVVKLNTNECPFPPSEKALRFADFHTRPQNLYSDPQCTQLAELVADLYDVEPDMVILNNGSDETLNFAFMAFCDEEHPAAFADITYGFYPVFAQLNHVPFCEIPLQEDFSIRVDDYCHLNKTIFLANPNAPTGRLLSVEEIERIVSSNPNNVVVIDEAYIDFGGQTCVPLVKRYDNLLVVQTFSKSRSMAGARLGFGIGSKALIKDLHTIRYSTNPYNINSYTMALGVGTLLDPDYTRANCVEIARVRSNATQRLQEMGFEVLPSAANFVFARHKACSGETIYNRLKEKGILVRHFNKERIADYNRITIGTADQMEQLLKALERIIEEEAL